MKTRAKIASAGLGTALLFSGGAAPASAAPVISTPVSVQTGFGAGAYEWWCNWYGAGCYSVTRKFSWGSFKDICSNMYCTDFVNHRAHPPLIKTTYKGVVYR